MKQNCSTCIHYKPTDSMRGNCGTKYKAPVDRWSGCSGWKAKNWDVETAVRCRLCELIPEICDTCRDRAMCKRSGEQISVFDIMKGGRECD